MLSFQAIEVEYKGRGSSGVLHLLVTIIGALALILNQGGAERGVVSVFKSGFQKNSKDSLTQCEVHSIE